MTKPIDTETTVDTTIWYSVEYSRKDEDDWYAFDRSIDTDTLDAVKLRLAGRIKEWEDCRKRNPDAMMDGPDGWKFRIVRKELTTVALADEVEVEVGEGAGTEVES